MGSKYALILVNVFDKFYNRDTLRFCKIHISLLRLLPYKNACDWENFTWEIFAEIFCTNLSFWAMWTSEFISDLRIGISHSTNPLFHINQK